MTSVSLSTPRRPILIVTKWIPGGIICNIVSALMVLTLINAVVFGQSSDLLKVLFKMATYFLLNWYIISSLSTKILNFTSSWDAYRWPFNSWYSNLFLILLFIQVQDEVWSSWIYKQYKIYSEKFQSFHINDRMAYIGKSRLSTLQGTSLETSSTYFNVTFILKNSLSRSLSL